MSTLQDLNNYANQSFEYIDYRTPGIITDINGPIPDQVINITTQSIDITPPVEILEIINWQDANVKFYVKIVTSPENPLEGSTITWPTGIPDHLTLTSSTNNYLISGLKVPSDWNAIKAFTWNLPSNWQNKPFWFLDIGITWTADGINHSLRWNLYDDRFYYVSQMGSNFLQNCVNTKIVQMGADMYCTTESSFENDSLRRMKADLTSYSVISVSVDVTVILSMSASSSVYCKPWNQTDQFVLYKAYSKKEKSSWISRYGYVGNLTESYLICSSGSISGGSGQATLIENATGNIIHTFVSTQSWTGTEFGFSSATNENTSAVSEPMYRTGTTINDFVYPGQVTVYSNTTGLPINTISNLWDQSPSPRFGHSLAMNSTKLVVGAPSQQVGGVLECGSVYLYSSGGGYITTIANPNTSNLNFGASVKISNNYIAVSTSYSSTNNYGSTTGKVYVFSASNYQLIYSFSDPNGSTTSSFGSSIDITDTYLIVGAPGHNSGDGIAYIYNMSSGTLYKTITNPGYSYAPNGWRNDRFGTSVGLSEEYAIVGAPGEWQDYQDGSGKAYIFTLSTGLLAKTLENPSVSGGTYGEGFGSSVTINTNYAAISAPYEVEGVGASYLYCNIRHTPQMPVATIIGSETGTQYDITISSWVAKAGDYAFLFRASSSASITPAGWTEVSKISTTGLYSNIYYKKLLSSDIGTTISTGARVLFVVRPNFTPSSIDFSTVVSEATTGTPTDKTIVLNGIPNPSVAFAVFAGTTQDYNKHVYVKDSQGLTYTQDGNSAAYADGTIWNSVSAYTHNETITPENLILSMQDFGSNSIQGFYVRFNQ